MQQLCKNVHVIYTESGLSNRKVRSHRLSITHYIHPPNHHKLCSIYQASHFTQVHKHIQISQDFLGLLQFFRDQSKNCMSIIRAILHCTSWLLYF